MQLCFSSTSMSSTSTTSARGPPAGLSQIPDLSNIAPWPWCTGAPFVHNTFVVIRPQFINCMRSIGTNFSNIKVIIRRRVTNYRYGSVQHQLRRKTRVNACEFQIRTDELICLVRTLFKNAPVIFLSGFLPLVFLFRYEFVWLVVDFYCYG